MKKLLIAGAAGAALIAGTAVLAQPTASTPAAPGKVHTRASVQSKVAEHFARLDTNRDGFVTKAEADAVKASHATRRGERKAKRSGATFERMDANRDGSIARAEFDAARAKREQRVAARDKDGDGRPDARRMRGERGFGALGGHMFETADANRDGRVSLQEATGAALRHFDAADTNRDGQVSREERRQMWQQMRGQRRPG
jgi:Ca2+-binding EF-hand superfamily protein